MPIYENFYIGQSKSKSDQRGFDNLVNMDVFTDIGHAQCQLALVSESATPNEDCISASVTNGDVFFFSTESGKIWKRTAAGVYSLVHTNTNGSHAGAMLFDGILYYSTAADLGKQTEALASSEASWSSETDDFAAYDNDNANKPMAVVGSGLYIGDGNLVAFVDTSGTFTSDGVDLPLEETITALTGSGIDLLIGTQVGTNISTCNVYLWDRVSVAWTLQDPLPENGVNCFIPADNLIIAQAGKNGQLYYWTGQKMEKLKKIRGVSTVVAPYNSAMLNGRSLFATGAKVFAIHREDRDFPYAVVQEYTATTGSITSLSSANSQLQVATGANIDKIGTDYATATIDTPESEDAKQKTVVKYDSIGSGGVIGIATKIDDAGSFTAKTVITSTIKKKAFNDGGEGTANFKQSRITLTPSGANNIVIKSIE